MPGSLRAEHIGSLLRPPELLKARAEHGAGRVSPEQLRDMEDRVIRQILEKQRQWGLTSLRTAKCAEAPG